MRMVGESAEESWEGIVKIAIVHFLSPISVKTGCNWLILLFDCLC